VSNSRAVVADLGRRSLPFRRIATIAAAVSAGVLVPASAYAAPSASPSPSPSPSSSASASPSASVSASRSASASSGHVWDMATIGATVRGRVGETVRVTIGIKNTGTETFSFLQAGASRGWPSYFTVPAGTEVTTVYDYCGSVAPDDIRLGETGALGESVYRCDNDDKDFEPGEVASFTFLLKITKDVPRSTGSVFLSSPVVPEFRWKDDRPGNDTAPVVITVIDAAELPTTGSRTGLLATGGAVLLATGCALLLLARRRRPVRLE
jgi:LPXTG-motif cell wall-anchored protein